MNDSAQMHTAKALRALSRARSALVMEHPFFASLALRLRFKADGSCRDLWTDGRALGFNPVYAGTLPENKLVGALAHEVLHLAFGHHVRRKARDTVLWNSACDHAVNLVLRESGFALPDAFVCDPAYAGLSVDEIYARLLRLREKKQGKKGPQRPGAPAPLSVDAAQAADGEGQESHALNASARSAAAGGSEGDKKEGLGAAGGKAVTASEATAKGGESPARTTFIGEVRDHPDLEGGADAGAQKAAEREADVALGQAVRRALNMGNLPAGLGRLVKRSLPPRLDWKALLRRFLENCADSDYAWTTPNRRYLHQNIYLPSRREPRIPHLALAVDSSGSVDEEALALFCAELSSLLEDWDTTVTVLFHDTRVQISHSFTRQDLPLALKPVGGGGTDFRPVCDYVKREALMPSCLIWFTDMQCSRFPEEPPYPVLWVSTMPAAEPPPFGEVISLSPSA